MIISELWICALNKSKNKTFLKTNNNKQLVGWNKAKCRWSHANTLREFCNKFLWFWLKLDRSLEINVLKHKQTAGMWQKNKTSLKIRLPRRRRHVSAAETTERTRRGRRPRAGFSPRFRKLDEAFRDALHFFRFIFWFLILRFNFVKKRSFLEKIRSVVYDKVSHNYEIHETTGLVVS